MNGFISLIESTNSFGEEALTLAIFAAGGALLLAAAVLVVNLLVRRWVSASVLGLLWALVLVRLCLPMAPPASFSLQSLAAPLWAEEDEFDIPDAAASPTHPDAVEPIVASMAAPPAQAVVAPAGFNPLEWLLEHLGLVWLMVGTGSFAWTIARHSLFVRRVRRTSTPADAGLLDLWQSCLRAAGVRRRIPVCIVRDLEQPAILGLWRPRLLLTTEALELERRELRMVMLHELAHVRRWDVAQSWALLMLRSIHWWNPIYWLAAGRFLSLREQACDAFVVRRLGGELRRDYGELLLHFAQQASVANRWRVSLVAPGLGFLSGMLRRRAVKNRLVSLRKAGVQPTAWRIVGALGLVSVFAAVGLTDAKVSVAVDDPANLDWLPPAAVTRPNDWLASATLDAGPLETRSYDIEQALERIVDDFKTPQLARQVLQTYLPNILRLDVPAISTSLAEPAEGEDSQEKAAQPFPVVLEGTQLTVTAPAAAHAELARNIAAWEQSGLGQICIATRMITSDEDLITPLGVAWQYLETTAGSDDGTGTLEKRDGSLSVRTTASVHDYLPMAVATIDKRQATRLVDAAQSRRRTNVLQSPKVTLFNGQQASIVDCTQSPFVVGIRETASGEQQPRIAVLEEGIRLNMRATHHDDRRRVLLEGHIELSAIGDVRTASTKLPGELGAIQIPRFTRRSIDVRGDLGEGQSILVGYVPSYEKKQFCYLLLDARTVVAESQP